MLIAEIDIIVLYMLIELMLLIGVGFEEGGLALVEKSVQILIFVLKFGLELI